MPEEYATARAPAFEPETVTLRDGRRALIRPGRLDDAEAFRDYMIRSSPTSDHIGLYVDEVPSADEYRSSWEKLDATGHGLRLFAQPEDDPGVIVGDCCMWPFTRRKLEGVLVLGTMCDAPWRGVGLGRALMTRAMAWARANPDVRKVELGVLSTNPNAKRLYESLGFVEEGRRIQRFRQADGSLADDILMRCMV